MHASWVGLVTNLAAVLFVFGWALAQDRQARWSPRWRSAVSGLWFGGAAIGLMQAPFELQQGVFVDLRSTPIGIAGLFGGPLAGVVAGGLAAAYRIGLGGPGWASGSLGIAMATLVGILVHRRLHGGAPDARSVVLLGAGVGLGGVAGFLLLPRALWPEIMPTVAPPSAALTFVATVVAGFAMIQERRRREATAANAMYRAIIDALPDCLNAKDLRGRFIAANPATAELMCAGSVDRLIGRTDFDFYAPETAARFRKDEEEMLAQGVPVTVEQRFIRPDGTGGWLSTLKVPLRDAGGRIVGIITHNRDVRDLRKLESDLATSQRQLADALAHMADGLAVFDREGRLVYCNDQYRTMFPRTAAARVPGAHMRDILRASIDSGEEDVAPEIAEAWIDALCALLGVEGSRQYQLADGRWFESRRRVTADGSCLVVLTDITLAKLTEASLLAANARLDNMARTDALTGLPNRRAFDAELGRQLGRAAADGRPLGLLLVDVDCFKAFNDTYGHLAGDACLRAVADCLTRTLAERGSAARYGGEEFALVLPGAEPENAASVGEEVRAAVRELGLAHATSPKRIVTVSIGVATTAPGKVPRAAGLLHRADAALYDAKAAGRDTVVLAAPARRALRQTA